MDITKNRINKNKNYCWDQIVLFIWDQNVRDQTVRDQIVRDQTVRDQTVRDSCIHIYIFHTNALFNQTNKFTFD